MECSIAKAPLEGPFVVLSTPNTVNSSKDHSLDPPQSSEVSFPGLDVHPWLSLTVQDHPLECLHPSLRGPCFPGENRRPWTVRCQPCSSHSGSWLVYEWWKLRISLFCVFFLLILVSSLLGDPQGFGMLLMYAHFLSGKCCYQNSAFPYLFLCRHHCWSCTHNHTTYSVCFHDSQYICFSPIYCPQEQWLEVQSFTSTGKLINCTWVNDPKKPVSIYFDACAAIAENTGP
jgi:hypothetical protein